MLPTARISPEPYISRFQPSPPLFRDRVSLGPRWQIGHFSRDEFLHLQDDQPSSGAGRFDPAGIADF